MKLSRQGYSYKYHGDEVLKYWPWVRKNSFAKYYSSLLSRDFNSFPEYWKIIGEETALVKLTTSSTSKMSGFSLSEVIELWSARLWVNEFIVVLTDINPGAKGPGFWSRLTRDQRTSLGEDVVVLRCKDRSELTHLVDSTDPTFACAMGLLNGTTLCTNTWRE